MKLSVDFYGVLLGVRSVGLIGREPAYYLSNFFNTKHKRS